MKLISLIVLSQLTLCTHGGYRHTLGVFTYEVMEKTQGKHIKEWFWDIGRGKIFVNEKGHTIICGV